MSALTIGADSDCSGRECGRNSPTGQKGGQMAANTIERVAVQATLIDQHPSWKKPVIPVVAGITGWSAVEDDGFARWFHRPGEVVLGVWYCDWQEPVRSDDEVFRVDPPAFELALNVREHSALLFEAMAAGGATLAVLEFRGGEADPPDWGTVWVEADEFGKLIQLAMGPVS